MLRAVVFICALTVLDLATGRRLFGNFGHERRFLMLHSMDRHRNRAIQVEEPKYNRSTCKVSDAWLYSTEFHDCFTDRKYNDGGHDLKNIVDRILEHSRFCVENLTRECRPDFEGFMIIMDKVITQMKDYCYMYLELITHGRNDIKDLQCVETSLSNETYESCFKEVFEEGIYLTEIKFLEKAEKAISCTNKSLKSCSKEAKTSLNRMVRTILGMKQPVNDNIEDEVMPKPPMMWYDYLFQPFISMWKAITSFFGF